ncbi:FTR1 family protein [Candidatus Woesearchaeota archaeon]|nr:FTR1 family protein [Candidatus Woesearchaeota archaeon]
MSSFIITSRETLEAALVVGVVMAYLSKTQNNQYKKTVYYGIGFGIILSLLSAFLFTIFAGGFSGTSEKIFEGSIMLVAAILLTTMILWMMKQQNVAKNIENKVSAHITSSGFNTVYSYGLFALITVAILREGIETVLFFGALNYSSGISLFGAVAGVLVAIAAGYMFFATSKNISLKKFFTFSSIFLILISAGLVAHGIHEFQEASIIPYVVKEVWNVNPAVVQEGIYPAMHEKGAVGSFLTGLFGYNGNPSLIEVLSYLLYLGIILYVYFNIGKLKFSKKTV